MQITIPGDVLTIIEKLEEAGHSAYMVGGCVRDALMGITPHDYDITTSAKPEEIKKVFKKTIDTGIQHGTVTVIMHGVGYEVTTFRIDGEYKDSRHPKNVSYTDNLAKDLERRDFTINAMAYSKKSGLIDIFNGKEDLERKTVRAVGDPYERFKEDALRILRAIRFAAQLNFTLDEKTKEAVVDLRKSLNNISRERVRAELEKTLLTGSQEKLMLLFDTNVYDSIFTKDLVEINNSDFEKVCKTVAKVSKVPYLKWAAFFSDCDEKTAQEEFNALKFDNKTKHGALTLISALKKDLPDANNMNYYPVRKHIHDVGLIYYPDFIELYEAVYEKEFPYKEAFEKIKENNDPLMISDLALTGKDLINEGETPGPSIGKIIDALVEKVLENPSLNKKEMLINEYKKLKKEM